MSALKFLRLKVKETVDVNHGKAFTNCGGRGECASSSSARRRITPGRPAAAALAAHGHPAALAAQLG